MLAMARIVASLVVLLMACTFYILGQNTSVVDVRCTPSYCGEWLNKNKCPPLSAECLETGTIFVYPGECGCCDYCITYLEEDAWCDIGQPGQPTPGSICGAGLTCVREDGSQEMGRCKRMDSTCHRAQDAYDQAKLDGTLGHLMQRPACDQYGDFAAATCIPGSICYCTDPKGKRIFGEVAYDSPDLQRTLTCKCSKDAWKASQLGLGLDAVFAHCLQNGSYDPLQCVDNTCTCVDQEGMPNQARIHVADLNVSSPMCFSKDLGHKVGAYVRKCELIRSDMLARQRSAVEGNATVVINELPNCGLDGRYERIQPRGDWLVCTDPDGNQIENFQQSRYIESAIDCNCARTRYTLREAAKSSGLYPNIPQCCSNGNFKKWQCNRGLCYCVDSNGNQVEHEVPEGEESKLSCYTEAGGQPCPS